MAQIERERPGCVTAQYGDLPVAKDLVDLHHGLIKLGGSIQIADALTNPGPYIAGDTAFALPEAGTTLDYQTSFYVGLTIVISEMTNGSVTISFG